MNNLAGVEALAQLAVWKARSSAANTDNCFCKLSAGSVLVQKDAPVLDPDIKQDLHFMFWLLLR